jgi:hypothetical protein
MIEVKVTETGVLVQGEQLFFHPLEISNLIEALQLANKKLIEECQVPKEDVHEWL